MHGPATEPAHLPPLRPTLRQLVTLSDDELARCDIAEVNLICAEGIPLPEKFSVVDCLRKLDDCAKEVRQRTAEYAHIFEEHPEEFKNSQAYFRSMVLATVIQEWMDIKIDQTLSDLPDHIFFKDARNTSIHAIMQGYSGTCSTMSILFAAVGRRLGYPIKLVRSYYHLFARWEEPGEQFNIECAIEGFASLPNAHYLEWPQPMKAELAEQLGFLKTLTPRQEAAICLFHRAWCLYCNNCPKEATDALVWGYTLSPDSEFWVAPITLIYLQCWRFDLAMRTPLLFPAIKIIWPQKRRFTDRMPLEVEQEILRLGIWDSLLKDPDLRQDDSLCVSWNTGDLPRPIPKQIEVYCT